MPLRFLYRCPDTCETCRFWEPDQHVDDTVLGECLIHAPEFNPLPGDPDDAETQAGLPCRPWPLTESRDWCVEWRA